MTPNWDFLLDEASLASLLPAEYSSFARPIRDALSLFLGGLPESQQASILMAQAKLPPAASFSQRLGVLARSSPVLHKLGQVLARDQRLPRDLRGYLRELESLSPSVPLEKIREILTQELGPLDRLGLTLEPAIAEASVAVVIPFRQGNRPGGDHAVPGVLKVLKPGIEQQLNGELSLLESVGEHLDSRCEELQIPHLDYQESFQQARDKLLDEIQLENEQRHLVQAKAFFADEPRVRIPGLLEHCTSRVTAMERLSGGKVTSHAMDTARRKRRLARLVAKSLIAKPVFSKSDQPLFHGDPHAGNLFLTDDGCVGILDWSLAGTLGVDERIAIVQMILAAITLDTERIVSVLATVADRGRLDDEAIAAVVGAWIRRVRRGQFPGLSWLVGMLDEAVQKARLRVSADLMLFRKSLLTLEGVVADVGECSGQIDKTLSLEFLRHFAAEYPERWLRSPNSREFSTRLSNLDMIHTLLSYPTAVTRFWTGHTFDILEACVSRWEASLRSGPRV
jgi:ubiquinone biosynthesis protein